MRHHFNKHPFLWLLIANVLWYSIIALTLPICFEDNDDIIMLLIASGKYSGSPDGHLVFINIIYGWLVAGLYQLTSKVEWYTLLFIAWQILSTTVIGYTLIKQHIDKWVKGLLLLTLYAFALRLMVTLQFTTTAAICTVAAIALIHHDKKTSTVAGMLLFAVASLIRFDSAMLVLLLLSPLFIKEQVTQQRLFLNRKTALFVMMIAMALILKWTDNQIYTHSDEWRTYRTYNVSRGQVNDNPQAQDNGLAQKVNLAPTDYDLLMSFFPDPAIITQQKLDALKHEMDKKNTVAKFLTIWDRLTGLKLWLLLTGVVLGLVVAVYAMRRRPMLFLFLVMGAIALVLIKSQSYLKARVMLAAALSYLLMAPAIIYGTDFKRWERLIGFGVMLLIPLFLLVQTATIVVHNTTGKATFLQQQKLVDLYLSDNTKTLVPFAADFHIQRANPFICSKQFHATQIYFSGWATNLPFHSAKFESFNSLVDGHALFMSKENIDTNLPKIIDGIDRQYGKKITPLIVLSVGDYSIVELVSTNQFKSDSKDFNL